LRAKDQEIEKYCEIQFLVKMIQLVALKETGPLINEM
jgi:hypothetical protein